MDIKLTHVVGRALLGLAVVQTKPVSRSIEISYGMLTPCSFFRTTDTIQSDTRIELPVYLCLQQ
jgi:hypothetical protein